MKNYKNLKLRSKCPLSCALDLLGDKWSLLIIRDMLHFKKKTFKDFFASVIFVDNIKLINVSSDLSIGPKKGQKGICGFCLDYTPNF